MTALCWRPQRSVERRHRAWQDRLRCGRMIAKRTKRSYRVVMVAPAFDQYLRLLQCVEDFCVQNFISQFAVEAFVVTVLPRAARRDVERLHTDPAQPFTHSVGRALRTVVATDVFRPSATWSAPCTCSTQARRQAGLNTFPSTVPLRSACPKSDRISPWVGGGSLSPDP